MLEALERMSQSSDWVERVRAARLVARLDPATNEAIVLRLLRDGNPAVSDAMVVALLDQRREAAIPLVVRVLGQKRAAGQGLLEGLLNSELDGVDVRGTLASVLLETQDRHELVGTLQAIGWLAPSGGFPAPPGVHERVNELIEHSEEAIRVLARQALVALG